MDFIAVAQQAGTYYRTRSICLGDSHISFFLDKLLPGMEKRLPLLN